MGKNGRVVCAKRNPQHEIDPQQPLIAWVFEDAGCSPRDSFIPKQESDKKNQLIQQVSYKRPRQIPSSNGFAEGFWRQTVALCPSDSTTQRGTAVLSCYLQKRQFRTNFSKKAIKACLPRPHILMHKTFPHAPQHSNSNSFLLYLTLPPSFWPFDKRK